MSNMHPTPDEIMAVYESFVLRSPGDKSNVELCARQWIERMLEEPRGPIGIAEAIITMWETYKATERREE